MAGYKANNNPKTNHSKKMYHDKEVRVCIMYSNGSKFKCGVTRDTQGFGDLIVDSTGNPIPYNQIPYNTPNPLHSEVA